MQKIIKIMNSKWHSGVMGRPHGVRGTRWEQRQSIVHSSFFKHQGQSNFIDKKLIFVCYNILRSLIHEPKQAHYSCNCSLPFLHMLLTAYRVPRRSQLLRYLPLLYMSLTVYRVGSYLDNFLSYIYHSQRTAYRVASYAGNFLSCIYHSMSTT